MRKVYIVTGGGSGIGAAITNKLIDSKATVIVAQRTETGLSEYIHTDLSNPDDCEQLISQTIAKHQRLDGLVNNAGVMMESNLADMSLDDWQRSLAINLTAPFLLCKFALPHLKKTAGSIVNIGSVEGLAANPNHGAYCASKGGLHALTRAIAVDEGQHGIRCNAIVPGWVDTDLNNDFINAMPNPQLFKNNLSKIHPLGRTGSAQEIANIACWLLSEQASFVTGQVWTVDGGRMAKLSLP